MSREPRRQVALAEVRGQPDGSQKGVLSLLDTSKADPACPPACLSPFLPSLFQVSPEPTQHTHPQVPGKQGIRSPESKHRQPSHQVCKIRVNTRFLSGKLQAELEEDQRGCFPGWIGQSSREEDMCTDQRNYMCNGPEARGVGGCMECSRSPL